MVEEAVQIPATITMISYRNEYITVKCISSLLCYEYVCMYVLIFLGYLGGLVVKNLPTNAGDIGSIPGLGRFPGEGNGNHSSILAWRILWTEEPSWPQSMSQKELAMTEQLNFIGHEGVIQGDLLRELYMG